MSIIRSPDKFKMNVIRAVVVGHATCCQAIIYAVSMYKHDALPPFVRIFLAPGVHCAAR